MPDTALSPERELASRNLDKISRTLPLARVFTRLGGNVFSEVEWDKRVVVIKGMNGATHEEKDCEFPVFWSVNAANIAGSKYFRGRLGSETRERSIKQVISRVVKTIREWGVRFGYFDEVDADIFADELTHILLYQKAAFNSPVWFNVGVEEKPQCSACFILAVEDSLQSILDWIHTEGMIFKGGSGAGINLSTLRSSRETLSKGGRSSGPVSFMRGADSVAGMIASGGSTRRAAKMVVMNIDHPDIIQFIRCKAEEEKKVRALLAAGYDMQDLNNEGWKSIQYQNANNSVRVSDEFMQAAENDGMWSTRLVTGGGVAEEYRARDLLREIAQAAWECGDPGMQYDTTANDWNTVANTGRINATNPCVTGETLVATQYGWRPICELVGETPVVATTRGWQRVKRVWQTGVKPVYRMITRSGYSLRLTADHRVFIPSKGDVPLHAIKPGDKVEIRGAGFGNENLPEVEAFAVGYGVGDGCILNNQRSAGRREWKSFVATGGEADRGSLEIIAEYINNEYREPDRLGRTIAPVHVTQATTGLKIHSSRPRLVERLSVYAILDRGSEGKKFTPHVFNLNAASQAALLRGLFTADGTISGSTAKGYYVGLDSTSRELLTQAQLLLLNFGIKSKLYWERKKPGLKTILDSKRNPADYMTQGFHSLRVTRSSRVLFEQYVGFAAESPKAEKLRVVNKQVGTYRDELEDEVVDIRPDGIEPVYDLTEPVSHHFVANGIIVHNCGEYVHIDNSACNLASINLAKFLNEDRTFQVEEFRQAVRIMILAQEILVDGSSYPAEKIAQNAHNFRELGLGYANLGALLMALGLPYDSEAGRESAAAITSLMSGESYRYSAETARRVGPFPGFEVNREPMLRVLKKHRDAMYNVKRGKVFDERIYDAAVEAWNESLRLGELNGVRNSQVTVIAPTGTIALMMDCDTTGVEPDFALVKTKSLVGGGTMKIVNRTVARALKGLGYNDQEIGDMLDYIEREGTIEGAMHIKNEHLAVFDCAVKPAKGARSISWQGHVKMVAAVQPFISGGLSKTFNMSHETTVEEIMEAYVMAWKMGIKAFAVYRDGSKAAQPLVTSSGKGGPVAKQGAFNVGPMRRRLPTTRGSETHKFSIAGHEGYLTYSVHEDGELAEIFIRMAKTGSTLGGLLDAFAIAVSMALQYSVPLKELVRKFIYSRYEPAGFTENPQVQIATSITDYIFRYLAIRFLNEDELIDLGVNGFHPTPAATLPKANPAPKLAPTQATVFADSVCRACGGMMIQTGSCKTCLQCGNSNGGC
ncbi:MAG: intein-containing adenosylcobalamin-dependent ribonucleoside-diphosphate reductase [Candidatus Sungbacteria bacterium]|nr:intein-containing adenosylcobalamin-dependent ribonucleoside-diphosphate reductase [Candidatus Sungbacteria bacterium]